MEPDIRVALEPVCAALARLTLRLHQMEHSHRRRADGTIDVRPLWTVADIQPPSVWLSGYPEGNALSGAVRSVLRVQVRLLTALASGDPIDPYWACRILQHLSGECAEHYSPSVTRLAAHFDLNLPGTPRDMTNGVILRDEFIQGEWLPKAVT